MDRIVMDCSKSESSQVGVAIRKGGQSSPKVYSLPVLAHWGRIWRDDSRTDGIRIVQRTRGR